MEWQGARGESKLRYYKDKISPTLSNKNYLFVLTSTNKKMIFSKINTNSHEILTAEIGLFPKQPRMKEFVNLYDLLSQQTIVIMEHLFILFFIIDLKYSSQN